MSACATCARGSHALCTGYDGPLTTHPDSLPRCACDCNTRVVAPTDTTKETDR